MIGSNKTSNTVFDTKLHKAAFSDEEWIDNRLRQLLIQQKYRRLFAYSSLPSRSSRSNEIGESAKVVLKEGEIGG